MRKPPQLNEDGYSVQGCSIIRAPRGQALEYGRLTTAPYRGCGHKCSYCYVPLVLKMKRTDFDAKAEPRKDYLKRLISDASKYQALGITEQVLFSFTTDPYHPFDTTLTREAIVVLQGYGLGFCTLTKGGLRALRDSDLYRAGRDAFACTLTSLDAEFSRKWERGAALPAERVAALRTFHERGIFTWASLEPTLSVEHSLRIVEETHPFVDLYKIGMVNYLPITKTTDWRDYTLRMLELVNKVGVKHYFKKDLQQYLPEGYFNPVHIPQHK
jgi:DNA repair photolyase